MRLRVKIVIIVVNVIAMFCGLLVFSVAPHYSTKEKIEKASTLPLEKDKYPKVTKLIKKYLNARFEMDMDALEECVNDINIDEYSEENLEKENAWIESIESIDCYTIDGYYDNSYVVLVYKEQKIKNMDVVAPTVVMYYVCEYKGKLVVFTKSLEDMKDASEQQQYEISMQYYENAKDNPAVVALADKATKEADKLAEENEDYAYFRQLVKGLITPTPEPTPTPTPEPKSTNKDKSFG